MPALLRRGLETLIRPYPALEVTSIGPEVDPAAAAIGKADVDAIWGAAVAAYDSGLYPALALCLRRRGKVILDRAIGHARGNGPGDAADVRKVRARHDGLYCMFSASKMVTRFPLCFRAKARLMTRFVLPTPPFPEVMAMRFIGCLGGEEGLRRIFLRLSAWSFIFHLVRRADPQAFPGKRSPGLPGPVARFRNRREGAWIGQER